jgi:hypothetical protein
MGSFGVSAAAFSHPDAHFCTLAAAHGSSAGRSGNSDVPFPPLDDVAASSSDAETTMRRRDRTATIFVVDIALEAFDSFAIRREPERAPGAEDDRTPRPRHRARGRGATVLAMASRPVPKTLIVRDDTRRGALSYRPK